MQLWKKNFLVIYGVFLVVVCAGLLLLDAYISLNEMKQWVDQAREKYLLSGCRA